MPDAGQEVDGLLPFVLGEADLAQERVQMPHYGRQNGPQPFVRGVSEAGHDGVDQLLLSLGLCRACIAHVSDSVQVSCGSSPDQAARKSRASAASSIGRGLPGGTSAAMSLTAAA